MRQVFLLPLMSLLAACTPAPAPDAAPAPVEEATVAAGPVPADPVAALAADAADPASADPSAEAPVATATFAEAAPAASAAGTARLSGRITYPSEELPVMRVCAVDSTDPGSAVCVRTAAAQDAYSLDVPAGSWWLLAWPQDTGTEGDPGLYSAASVCLARGAAGCDDHALALVDVRAGEVREGLDINDWYYDRSEFPPPMPPQDPDDGSQ